MAEEKKDVSRRDFIGRSVVVSGGALATLAVAGCASKSPATMGADTGASAMESTTQAVDPSVPRYRVPLADAPELQANGGVKRVQHSGMDFFVVRKSDTEVVAFNNVCTHKNCKTKYDEPTKAFKCPCHRSSFDLDGQPMGGPALTTGGLKAFPATLSDGVVQVTLQL